MVKKCKICKKKSHVNMKCECGKTYCIAHIGQRSHECEKMPEESEQKLENAQFKKVDKI